MVRRGVAALLATAGSLSTAVLPASAEWFVDVYARGSFTGPADVTTRVPDLDQRTTLSDVGFDTSSAARGGRLGYWLESPPVFGLGIDAFRFRPDIRRQTRTAKVCSPGCAVGSATFEELELSILGVTLDARFRAPGMFATDSIPNGRLQPYLTVGPTVFIAEAEDSTNFAEPSRQSDTDVAVGLTVGWGLAWQFHKHWAIFTEYRFTHVSPTFQFTSFGAKTTVRTTLDTHHAIGGISFRF